MLPEQSLQGPARPRISVIVPTHCDSQFLGDALASIFEQRNLSLEIVIVADQPPPDHAARIASFADRARIVWLPENRGPAGARNAGLAQSQGEFVAFLDADDLWPVGRLDRLLAVLEAQPNLGFVLGHTEIVRYRAGATAFAPEDAILSARLAYVLGAGLFRRTALERVGLFDPTLRFGEDSDWFIRAREQQLPCAIFPENVLYYRRHGANMTQGKTMHELFVPQTLLRSLARRRQATGAAKPLAALETVRNSSQEVHPRKS